MSDAGDHPSQPLDCVQRWCDGMRVRIFRHASGTFDAVPPRSRRVVLIVAALLGSIGVVSTQTAEAATSGWYVATVPGTGADDVLLGSTCANALQCWAVGITLVNLGGGNPSSVSPLVEAWNGTTWTLVPMPLPGGEGGGLFDATCVNGSDCWAVGAVVATGSGNPTGTLIEHWNGTSWSVVPSPTPSGPGRGGRHPLECELRVGVELHGGRLCDGREWEQSHRRCRAVERVQLDHRPRCGHRPGLRPAAQCPLPLGEQLLGRRQRRSGVTDVGLPSDISRRCRRPGPYRALGRIGLVDRAERDRAGAQRRLPERPRMRRRHRLLGLGRHDRSRRPGRPRGSSWSIGTVHVDRCVGVGARAPRRRACWPGSPV